LSSLIECRGLVKRYGRVEALRGLNLNIGRGALGLIGPNAAGKSTTLKILLGLVRASGGEAKVFGLDVWRDSFAVRKRVGVLHEKPSFPGWVRGLEYVEYLARLKGVKGAREAALNELRSFGLENAVDRKIGTYSAGMVQRLGLAQAFVGGSELVFLDEPTANLDPLGRADFLEKIRERVRSLGISVVISTHILSELERVCDSVAIIYGGVCLETGGLGVLFDRYAEDVYLVESSDDGRLMEGLGKLSSVERVWVEEGQLRVKVRNRGGFERDLVGVAYGLGVGVRRFEPVWHSLEYVYKKVLEVKGVGA